MVERYDILLGGCRPEPLLSYLKALGAFRLVAEQADPGARSYWSGEEFRLVCSLPEDGLVRFFLEEYAPTPLLAPWNGGSGFYPKDRRKALEAIRNSRSPRYEPYRTAIQLARDLLGEAGISAKPSGENKEKLLVLCRRRLPDNLVRWLDAAYVLSLGGPHYPPILGTGANDGRLEFTNNFMQRLVESLPPDGQVSPESRRWLEAALLGRDAGRLVEAPVGQFFPGGVGGPNATQGFKGNFLVNPWDYILMMEGTLLLAGSVVRRMDGSSESLGKAAFPFTVNATPAGWSSISNAEASASRGELWLPLWARPATLRELEHLFAEGRAEAGRRRAQDGLDFARAAVLLGVDRGIASFQRYGLFERSGKAYLAAPIGRLSVTARPEGDLLMEADGWLSPLKSAARVSEAPAGISAAYRRVADAMFQFCLHGGARRLQDILISLGAAERYLSKAASLQGSVSRPLHDLSTNWLYRADDGTPEFRLAAALASIEHPQLGGVRTNMEPVECTPRRYKWTDRPHSVVWAQGDPGRSLGNVLERRLLDAEIAQVEGSPLAGYIPAALADIDLFLRGGTDDGRLGDLLWGLVTLRWEPVVPPWNAPDPPPTFSRAYALLKMLFLSEPLRWGSTDLHPAAEPEILLRLRRGDVRGACRIAARRLRASGVVPMAEEFDAPRREAERILAALLFPLSRSQAFRLASLVLRKPTEEVAGG